MQYEWTPPQIFFCGHRALQLFCHNVERDHDIKCSQKQLELKFCWFQRLGSKFTRGSIKKAALKNFGIFTGIHLCQSIFSGCSFIRKRLWHRGISVNLARLLRTPFLQNASRWLLLFYHSCWLYILQLCIAGNFQVV